MGVVVLNQLSGLLVEVLFQLKAGEKQISLLRILFFLEKNVPFLMVSFTFAHCYSVTRSKMLQTGKTSK